MRSLKKMMMMTTIKSRPLILVCIVTMFCRVSNAQHTDLAGWCSAGTGFDLFGNFSAELSEELRYNFSIAELYQTNSDIGLNYKINKHFKASADFRYSIRTDKQVNRPGVSLSYKTGYKKFDAVLKTRMQYSFIPDLQEGSAWRNKLTIKYKINKHFSPYVAAELFYSFTNEIQQFDDYRLEAGMVYDLNKHHELSLGYLFDNEFNVNDPVDMHIFSLGYFYSF